MKVKANKIAPFDSETSSVLASAFSRYSVTKSNNELLKAVFFGAVWHVYDLSIFTPDLYGYKNSIFLPRSVQARCNYVAQFDNL
jgi:hypothetical protein